MKNLIGLLIFASLLKAEILYQTDFDSFPTGPNQWAGNEGWISNDTSSGAQSIDDGVIPSLLKTASLGFARPNNKFTFVTRNFGYDHLATGKSVIEIDTLLGIEDSSNNRRDDFFLSFYNHAGNRLASIRFDNQNPADFLSKAGIWREDGVSQFDTQIDFINGEIFNLFVTIDLATKRWSADIGGIPLFENAVFTNTSHPVNFGFLAFEWDLTSLLPSGYGNNFLLVADLIVRTPIEIPDLVVTHGIDANGQIQLAWPSANAWRDQVEFSNDLVTWQDTLPNSTFDGISDGTVVSFTDQSGDQASLRFYRVRRSRIP